jgi:cation:H+ antiporter
MEHFLSQLFTTWPMWALFIVTAFSFFALAKGADILVDQSIQLSLKWGIPRLIIGATIVSLGTTLPEVTVSVVAALNGDASLALGNAVGSIIADTGLILGLALLISPIHLNKKLMHVQGNLQWIFPLMLVIASFIFAKNGNPFVSGGFLPQWFGFALIGLLVLYIAYSIMSSKQSSTQDDSEIVAHQVNTWLALFLLGISMGIVIMSSKVLIPAVSTIATRLHIPEAVIGATLVALGTSMPELMTAIASARKGAGDIALGNIIGADILNILSVIGIALGLSPNGMVVAPAFFLLYYPAMLAVLFVFRLTSLNKTAIIGRKTGFFLIALYLVSSSVGYVLH